MEFVQPKFCYSFISKTCSIDRYKMTNVFNMLEYVNYTNRETKMAVEPDQFCWGIKTSLIVVKVNLLKSRPCSQLKSLIFVTCFCEYVQHEHQDI